MKLKNTSDKIIHVNTNILLPGQEISIAKSEPKEEVEEVAEEPEEEDKPKATRGRKASK